MSAPAKATGRGAVSGMVWTAGGFGVQAVAQFAVLALLARFLTPVEFGLVTAGLLVIGLVRIVTDALVGPAVTQKPDLTDDHVRSAFSLSVYVGTSTAVLLWLSSEVVVSLFSMPELGPVVRGLAPVLIVDALSTVPIALLQRDLSFRRLAIVEAVSFLGGYALVGCVLAVQGHGVWALIWAQLGYTGLRSLLVIAIRPHARSVGFSRTAAADVLRFGSGHSLGRVFNYAALQGDNFVVGRSLSAASLGIYGRAYQLAVKPAMYLGQAVDKVLFPVMASFQADQVRLAETYRRTVSLAASLSAPASVFGVVLGPEIVRVVLGPGWDAVILPFQILAAGLVARTGYKPSDSLARASGHVYARAWRQAVYAGLVVGGSLLGSRWDLPGVAGFVVLAIIINYLLMADLSLRVVDMRWSAFASAHGRGLAFATITALVCVPVATGLRTTDAGATLILASTTAVLALVTGLVLRIGGDRLIGPDLAWLVRRMRQLVGSGRSPSSASSVPGASHAPEGNEATRPGQIVAVVGADGSGKSTLTMDLVQTLGVTHKVERLYLGSGDGPASWYRAPLRLVRDLISPPATRKTVESSVARPHGRARTAVRTMWAVTLAMEKVGKTRHADHARRRGTIVICDRYPQTQFPGGNDGPLLASWASSRSWPLRSAAAWEARTYARAAAVTPDVLLKLDVSLPVALDRRPGLDPNYLQGRIALVRDLDLGCRVVPLDATQPYPSVRAAALEAITGPVRMAGEPHPQA